MYKRADSVVSVSLSNPTSAEGGIRPVNLRTDLAPMADLIELVFADSMDSSGRAAIREMRSLSRMGAGWNLLAGAGDLGRNMGFVWMADGRLIGNVSIYPASLPWGYTRGRMRAWIIANVGVHPDYRGRGIARRLMQTSLDALRGWARGLNAVAALQVEQHNEPALRLYESLGFVRERAWTTWRRTSSPRAPQPAHETPYITRRRRGEWRAEYALAARLRPEARGGMGWLRPLHPAIFQDTWQTRLSRFVNLRTVEHLVIRADSSDFHPPVLGALWIESAFAAATQLTLLVDPAYAGRYDDALLNLVVRRLGARDTLTAEVPTDETTTAGVFSRYGFAAQRTLVHMRWESG